MAKEYTSEEKAINFVYAFAEITNESQLTQLAKNSAKVALKRNIENLTFMAQKMSDKGHQEIADCLLVMLQDEKDILEAVECL